MAFDGKIIVLTGASSGIGAAAARQLAEAGAQLCLVARREDELGRLCAEIAAAGGTARAYPTDLTDEDAVDALAAQLLSEHGRVDVLINNAGRSIRRRVTDSLDRFHDYKRTMQLNYFAAVQLTLRLLPAMLERGDGHIINVSSMSALMPTPFFSAYVATKSALDAFSRSLGAELVDSGIAVTTINYPLVKTPMTAPTRHYRYIRQMDVDDAAGWIVEAVRKRPLRITSRLGALWSVSTAALPGPTTRWTGRAFDYIAQRLQRRAEAEDS